MLAEGRALPEELRTDFWSGIPMWLCNQLVDDEDALEPFRKALYEASGHHLASVADQRWDLEQLPQITTEVVGRVIIESISPTYLGLCAAGKRLVTLASNNDWKSLCELWSADLDQDTWERDAVYATLEGRPSARDRKIGRFFSQILAFVFLKVDFGYKLRRLTWYEGEWKGP